MRINRGGLMSGGIMSGGRMSGGRLSGGLKSYDRFGRRRRLRSIVNCNQTAGIQLLNGMPPTSRQANRLFTGHGGR